ncbi:CLIP domain-containing serine protease HP8-like [Bicyclus anynana]|uniref:CLIP domain-containing serine protease HP8-like n=1 Tax=Bicyclus anynana TaxID=110368 RepID=A0ABM3LY95_BICAN|nr:CLIP domain-containing serine protease HP8-like [Bicyclus anynana]
MFFYKGICIFLVIFVYHVKTDLWRKVSSHAAWKTLDASECGYSASDRIIGGRDAALGQFPWIVRLGYNTGDAELDWMCGGALLTDRHVVTAAHCVQTSDEYNLTTIRAGEHNTQTDRDCALRVCAPAVQDRNIKSIKSHSQYNKPEYHNDLALVVLDKPVQLNDYVLPICLPRREQLTPAAVRLGEPLVVAGWGTLNMTTEQRATVLQYVAVPVLPPERCNRVNQGFRLASTEICAGATLNKDACGGDSGGPMMKVFDTPDGPKTFLVGVVSFGPTICGSKQPGVYTSVPHFLPWMLDNIVK